MIHIIDVSNRDSTQKNALEWQKGTTLDSCPSHPLKTYADIITMTSWGFLATVTQNSTIMGPKAMRP